VSARTVATAYKKYGDFIKEIPGVATK